jgi:hypothetical protein
MLLGGSTVLSIREGIVHILQTLMHLREMEVNLGAKHHGESVI